MGYLSLLSTSSSTTIEVQLYDSTQSIVVLNTTGCTEYMSTGSVLPETQSDALRISGVCVVFDDFGTLRPLFP